VCYASGDYTLASASHPGLCGFHARYSGGAVPPGSSAPSLSASTAGGGISRPPNRPPSSARSGRWPSAGQVPERVLARGRRRAAARLAGGWRPHPGWRNFVPPGRIVLTDQRAVLRRIEQLLDGQEWRQDRRVAWETIMRRLVYSMDRKTGLVTGVPAATLAAAADRSERTVSDVIRWAKDAGLVFTVEEGAGSDFLRSKVNRTPTYAFLAGPPAASVSTSGDGTDQGRKGLCDLSLSPVGNQPLRKIERLEKTPTNDWARLRIPETPGERRLAAEAFLRGVGLDGRGVDRKRLYGLLKPWWEAGWCVNGLLWAIHHHPDTHARLGNARTGARDPLRTLGARLAHWDQRLNDLPVPFHGRRGDYQLAQTQSLAARMREPHRPDGDLQACAPASAAHRAAQRAAFAASRAKRLNGSTRR
jgi:hypothetical protein